MREGDELHECDHCEEGMLIAEEHLADGWGPGGHTTSYYFVGVCSNCDHEEELEDW